MPAKQHIEIGLKHIRARIEALWQGMAGHAGVE
jgi:hypothetical protein